MRLVLRWLATALALYITVLVIDNLFPGAKVRAQAGPLLIAAALLGLVNAIVRPVLILLALPLNCLTFGLFSFVINAVLFQAVGAITGAYDVGFLGALVGSIIMGLVSGAANHYILGEQE
ncbi:MAG: phage holin family protein [Armatimonadetes bacterium]|nr:phage holin family protein [Armatimonadota bacterium]